MNKSLLSDHLYQAFVKLRNAGSDISLACAARDYVSELVKVRYPNATTNAFSDHDLRLVHMFIECLVPLTANVPEPEER